jgi:hypothetical protein
MTPPHPSPSQTRGWRGLRRRCALLLLRAMGWELRGNLPPHFQHLTLFVCPLPHRSSRQIHQLLRYALTRQAATRPSPGWCWQPLNGSDPHLAPLDTALDRARSEGRWVTLLLVDSRRKTIDLHTPFLCSLHPDRAAFYIRRAFRYMPRD